MKIGIISSGLSGKYLLEELIKIKDFKIEIIITINNNLSHTKSTYCSFDYISKEHNIKLLKVTNINEVEVIRTIELLNLDLIIEMGWSQIISKKILEIPPLGVIGTHLSLLPKGRGHSPLNWALINGEKECGITLYYLSEMVDTGDIINQCKFNIEERDNINTLYNKATYLGVNMVKDYLELLKEGKIIRLHQNIILPPLSKRRPKDGLIDWNQDGGKIVNLVKALTKPFPGSYSYIMGKKVYIWEAENAKDIYINDNPGTIIKVINGQGVLVSTKSNPIILKRISLSNQLDLWADELIPKDWENKSFNEGDVLNE